jgi:membrane protein DedA with SNARE-associated domain
MSLKAFHIVFVMVSTLLALGFGAWAIRDYRLHHEMPSLVLGIGSLLGSVALVWYGRWFLRKLKSVSYL